MLLPPQQSASSQKAGVFVCFASLLYPKHVEQGLGLSKYLWGAGTPPCPWEKNVKMAILPKFILGVTLTQTLTWCSCFQNVKIGKTFQNSKGNVGKEDQFPALIPAAMGIAL